MKVKYILGTVTIVAIIGGTIYAIKKSKDMQKVEEEEITLADARKIVAAKETNDGYIKPSDGPVTIVNDKHNIKMTIGVDLGKTPGFTAGPFNVDGKQMYFETQPYDDYEEDEDEEETILNDEIVDVSYTQEMEEGDELRYDPNSKEARSQFIKMELAEWEPLEDAYQTLVRLFEFPFNPQNDGDDGLRTAIIDIRSNFFGLGSKWTKEVTYADVILHYARAAEFNVGESVRYWVNYFLDFNELDLYIPSNEIDELLMALNSHTYFNEERATFGLFGLTRESMDQAIRIANRNVDRSVTYEIEFNEFLKSCL